MPKTMAKKDTEKNIGGEQEGGNNKERKKKEKRREGEREDEGNVRRGKNEINEDDGIKKERRR
jgi:hypothetical protein